MAAEIRYRMTRLRDEADHERLVGVQAYRSSPRRWIGRRLVSFGRSIEGASAHERECAHPARA